MRAPKWNLFRLLCFHRYYLTFSRSNHRQKGVWFCTCLKFTTVAVNIMMETISLKTITDRLLVLICIQKHLISLVSEITIGLPEQTIWYIKLKLDLIMMYRPL